MEYALSRVPLGPPVGMGLSGVTDSALHDWTVSADAMRSVPMLHRECGEPLEYSAATGLYFCTRCLRSGYLVAADY